MIHFSCVAYPFGELGGLYHLRSATLLNAKRNTERLSGDSNI
jgi:hypothetical protein